MSRRKNIIPSVKLTVMLPEDTLGKLQLHLFSEMEGRVPLGAYQAFLSERIEEFFRQRSLDLAPFAGCDPGLFLVWGSPTTLTVLERALKGEITQGESA